MAMWWRKRTDPVETDADARCTFCNKAKEGLIAGPPGIFICEHCVQVCGDMIAERRARPEIAITRWTNRSRQSCLRFMIAFPADLFRLPTATSWNASTPKTRALLRSTNHTLCGGLAER